jgi:mono/diheme cytochrome c family protein
MKNIKLFSLLIVVALAVVWVVPTFAGGWAVATIDELPGQVVAGEPLTIGFMVRQHGTHPSIGLNASIRMQKVGSTDVQRVEVVEEGEPGHYTATLTFPTEGTWNWSLETGFYPEIQPMPALTVVSADSLQASTVTAPAAVTSPLPYVLGGVGLVGLAASLVVLARTRAPWAAATALAAALVGAYGFALVVPQTVASEPKVAVEPDMSVEQGERLFVAKGCVVCHTHEAVAGTKAIVNFNYEGAPNLSNFSAEPDYLAKWLDDPKALKPQADMPKLNLSDAEIGALVAFINAP